MIANPHLYEAFKDKVSFDTDSYIGRTRVYGEGLTRIGKSIELDHDIYCLAFVTQINDRKISTLIDIQSGNLVGDEDAATREAHGHGVNGSDSDSDDSDEEHDHQAEA